MIVQTNFTCFQPTFIVPVNQKFFRKNPNLSDPSCAYVGGSPPGRGVENTYQDPGYPFCAFVSKNNFFKKNSCGMPPMDPQGSDFFLKFFGPPEPLLYIFLLLYYCVPLIFSLFLFTFFSIIEGKAVVIQPPQFFQQSTYCPPRT